MLSTFAARSVARHVGAMKVFWPGGGGARAQFFPHTSSGHLCLTLRRRPSRVKTPGDATADDGACTDLSDAVLPVFLWFM